MAGFFLAANWAKFNQLIVGGIKVAPVAITITVGIIVVVVLLSDFLKQPPHSKTANLKMAEENKKHKND